MKKIISVLMVIAIIFAFAGCSQKDKPENDNTISQSDSDNLTTQPVKVEDDTTGSTQDSTDSAKSSTEKKTTEKTTEKTTKKAEKTTKATTAKKEETTEKRKIKLNVKFPYYNSEETTVKIEYKAAGDKSYTSLFDENDAKAKITLDKEKTLSYDIDKKMAGDVDIRITLKGIELLKNDFVVSAKDKEVTIELITSSEMLDGGMD